MFSFPIPLNFLSVPAGDAGLVDITGRVNVEVAFPPEGVTVKVNVDIRVAEQDSGKVYTETKVEVDVSPETIGGLIAQLLLPTTWVFDLIPPDLRIEIGEVVKIHLQLEDTGTGAGAETQASVCSLRVPLQLSWEQHYLCIREDLAGPRVHSGALARDILTDSHKKNAVWKVVSPGLGGEGTVSLESVAQPNHFLVHTGPTPFAESLLSPKPINLAPFQDSDDFKRRASFVEVTGLNGAPTVSYRLADHPNHYVWWSLGGYFSGERKAGLLPFGNDNVLTDASFHKEVPLITP